MSDPLLAILSIALVFLICYFTFWQAYKELREVDHE